MIPQLYENHKDHIHCDIAFHSNMVQALDQNCRHYFINGLKMKW